MVIKAVKDMFAEMYLGRKTFEFYDYHARVREEFEEVAKRNGVKKEN